MAHKSCNTDTLFIKCDFCYIFQEVLIDFFIVNFVDEICIYIYKIYYVRVHLIASSVFYQVTHIVMKCIVIIVLSVRDTE